MSESRFLNLLFNQPFSKHFTQLTHYFFHFQTLSERESSPHKLLHLEAVF